VVARGRAGSRGIVSCLDYSAREQTGADREIRRRQTAVRYPAVFEARKVLYTVVERLRQGDAATLRSFFGE
jgi:hypothetical protein